MSEQNAFPYTTKLTIRAECQNDQAAIRAIIERAFDGKPYASGDEADLVETLRAEGALSISLVAEVDGMIVGQIAFSPANALDSGALWYALGPVAVLPEYQRSGIGSKLVNTGLQIISESGANGCILTGNPNYYSRFGFEVSPSNAPIGEPAEFFMIKIMQGDRPDGPISFHKAFHGTA